MKYFCIIDHNKDGFTISCPDFPLGGFMANAETRDEAIAQAKESLAIYLREMNNPAPRFTKLADVPKTVLANLLAPPSKPEGLMVEPAPMNPVSLEIERILERSDQSLRSLAKTIGTSPAALTRLKDPFYWGHSVRSLRDVALACGQQLEVKFKPVSRVNQHQAAAD
jgi:antitoxin HicB